MEIDLVNQLESLLAVDPVDREIKSLNDILSRHLPHILEKREVRVVQNDDCSSYEFGIIARIRAESNVTHVFESDDPGKKPHLNPEKTYEDPKINVPFPGEQKKSAQFTLPRIERTHRQHSGNRMLLPLTPDHLNFTGLNAVDNMYQTSVNISLEVQIRLRTNDNQELCSTHVYDQFDRPYVVKLPIILGSKCCWFADHHESQKRGCFFLRSDNGDGSNVAIKFFTKQFERIQTRVKLISVGRSSNKSMRLEDEKIRMMVDTSQKAFAEFLLLQSDKVGEVRTEIKVNVLHILMLFYEDADSMKRDVISFCALYTNHEAARIKINMNETIVSFENSCKGDADNSVKQRNLEYLQNLKLLNERNDTIQTDDLIYKLFGSRYDEHDDPDFQRCHLLSLLGKLYNACAYPDRIGNGEELENKFVMDFGMLLRSELSEAIRDCKLNLLDFIERAAANKKHGVLPGHILRKRKDGQRRLFDNAGVEDISFRPFADDRVVFAKKTQTQKPLKLSDLHPSLKCNVQYKIVIEESVDELCMYKSEIVLQDCTTHEKISNVKNIIVDAPDDADCALDFNNQTHIGNQAAVQKRRSHRKVTFGANPQSATKYSDVGTLLYEKIKQSQHTQAFLVKNGNDARSKLDEVSTGYSDRTPGPSRLFHKSHLGIICRGQTPETEKCSITSHLAVFVNLSLFVEKQPLCNAVLSICDETQQDFSQLPLLITINNKIVRCIRPSSFESRKNCFHALRALKKKFHYIGVVPIHARNKDKASDGSDLVEIVIHTQCGRPMVPMIRLNSKDRAEELHTFFQSTLYPVLWMEAKNDVGGNEYLPCSLASDTLRGKTLTALQTPFGILKFPEDDKTFNVDQGGKWSSNVRIESFFSEHNRKEVVEVCDGKIVRKDANDANQRQEVEVEWISLIPANGSYNLHDVEGLPNGIITLKKNQERDPRDQRNWHFLNPIHPSTGKLYGTQSMFSKRLLERGMLLNEKPLRMHGYLYSLYNPISQLAGEDYQSQELELEAVFVLKNQSKNPRWIDLALEKGFIEYLDPSETNYYKGSNQITENELLFSHDQEDMYFEMSKVRLLSALCATLPLTQHEPLNRLAMAAIHGRQAAECNYGDEKSIDANVNHLLRSQENLISTRFGDRKCSQNIEVWVLDTGSKNVEDAMSFNENSSMAGCLAIVENVVFRDCAHSNIPVSHNRQASEIFQSPSYRTQDPTAEENLRSLSGGFFPKPGAFIKENSVIVSKVEETHLESGSRSEKVLLKSADHTQRTGMVHSVHFSHQLSNSAARVQTATIIGKTVEIVKNGDKGANGHGQKWTAKLFPGLDMFIDGEGVSPHCKFNPHGLPSRKTVSMFLEIFLGTCMIYGCESMLNAKWIKDKFAVDFTSFSSQFSSVGALDAFIQDLLKELDQKENKFDAQGTFKARCGLTGHLVDGIFGGPCSYHRLWHRSVTKINFRSTRGPITDLEKHPLKGRKNGGGKRDSPMEQHCALANNAHGMLQHQWQDNEGNYLSNVQNELFSYCEQCGVICTSFRCIPRSGVFVCSEEDIRKRIIISERGTWFKFPGKQKLDSRFVHPKFWEEECIVSPPDQEQIISDVTEEFIKFASGESIRNPFVYDSFLHCNECDCCQMTKVRAPHIHGVLQMMSKAGLAPLTLTRKKCLGEI